MTLTGPELAGLVLAVMAGVAGLEVGLAFLMRAPRETFDDRD